MSPVAMKTTDDAGAGGGESDAERGGLRKAYISVALTRKDTSIRLTAKNKRMLHMCIALMLLNFS